MNEMKKNSKKMIALIMCAVMLTLTAGGVAAYADFGSGVAALAQKTEIIKTALAGKKMIFSDVDFKQGLCITDFDSVNITAIPESNQGTLMLAGRRVGIGTTIKRKNLGALVFVPASKDVTECKFSFTTESFADGAEVDFILKFTDKVNYAPKTEEDGNKIKTQREVGVYGTMRASDGESDALEYIVIGYPEAGALKVLDANSGEFLYTPPTKYVGEDSFTYVARDEWGNFSKPCTVEITVSERMSEVVYADLKDHRDYNAAIALTAMGAVDGRLIGDGVYFMPEGTVTKAEFVTMAMKCAGIKADASLTSTYFDDNDEIPTAMMSYVATAANLGLIQGTFANGELLLMPNSPITKYEAAMIISEITEHETSGELPVFADAETVPVWAKNAVYEMCALGIFDTDSGEIRGGDALTKIQCTAYLYKMCEIL